MMVSFDWSKIRAAGAFGKIGIFGRFVSIIYFAELNTDVNRAEFSTKVLPDWLFHEGFYQDLDQLLQAEFFMNWRINDTIVFHLKNIVFLSVAKFTIQYCDQRVSNIEKDWQIKKWYQLSPALWRLHDFAAKFLMRKSSNKIKCPIFVDSAPHSLQNWKLPGHNTKWSRRAAILIFNVHPKLYWLGLLSPPVIRVLTYLWAPLERQGRQPYEGYANVQKQRPSYTN